MPLTSSRSYLDVGRLAACHLNAATPSGIFVTDDGAHTMLVHRHDEGAFALKLTGSPGQDFKVWTLEQNATSWFGLSLGSVEAEVDYTSMTREEAVAGCVEIRGANVYLVTLGDAPWERGLVRLSSAAGAVVEERRGAAFTRWRLVQRDHLGGPIELFVHDAEPSTDRP